MRGKVDALVWKRAGAFCYGTRIMMQRQFARFSTSALRFLWNGSSLAGMGLSFFGLIDYSQRQGDLLAEQETLLTMHFTDSPARTTDKICACILTQHGKSCCSSGAAKLLKRLGFTYKKLQSMPAQADEAKQKVFIAHHEALRPN